MSTKFGKFSRSTAKKRRTGPYADRPYAERQYELERQLLGHGHSSKLFVAAALKGHALDKLSAAVQDLRYIVLRHGSVAGDIRHGVRRVLETALQKPSIKSDLIGEVGRIQRVLHEASVLLNVLFELRDGAAAQKLMRELIALEIEPEEENWRGAVDAFRNDQMNSVYSETEARARSTMKHMDATRKEIFRARRRGHEMSRMKTPDK